MSATIKYRGSPIATIANGQTAVLECKGIKMNDDLEVCCDGGAGKFDEGYTEGYHKCEDDMQDDLQAKYESGKAEGVKQGRAEAFQEFETAIIELNTELENNIYGEVRGNDPEKNLEQVCSDFGAIKTSIVECGVDVPDGTPTSEYAGKVGEVYEKGKSEGGIGDDVKASLFDIAKDCGRAIVRPLTMESSVEDMQYDIRDYLHRQQFKEVKHDYLVTDNLPYNLFETHGYYIGAIQTKGQSIYMDLDLENQQIYLLILGPEGCQLGFLEGLNGRVVIEIYDPYDTLTEDVLYPPDLGGTIPLAYNVYSNTSGESKLRTDENGFVWYVDDERCILCDYIGRGRNISIPESYEGRECSFRLNSLAALDVDSIYIPKSIRSFTNAMFGNGGRASYEVNIILDDIEEWFEKDFSAATNPLSKYNAYLMCGGERLTDIVVPDSVETIPNNCFFNYSYLGSIVLPQSVKGFKDYAFVGCTNLTDITINGDITSLGRQVFSGCEKMTNVTVNGSIKISNSNLTFSGSPNLTAESMVSIMNSFVDNTGGSQYTVYFGSINLAKLTAEQKAIATNKNIKLA